MEYAKRNCSVTKGIQIRKHFKNTRTIILHYMEAEVKLPKLIIHIVVFLEQVFFLRLRLLFKLDLTKLEVTFSLLLK